MQIARSSLIAGVALVSAGALVITPINPALPDTQVPAAYSTPTRLTASFTDVFETSGGYAEALMETFLADPAPVLTQIIANQRLYLKRITTALPDVGDGLVTAITETTPAILESAVTKLTDGNVEGAVNDLLSLPVVLVGPFLPLLAPLTANITDTINGVNGAMGMLFEDGGVGLLLSGAGLATWLFSAVSAPVTGVQNLLDALGSGDPETIFNAAVDIPATGLDGLLNGGYGPNLGETLVPGLPVFGGGLLTPGDPTLGGLGVWRDPDNPAAGLNLAGPLQTLLTLRTSFADAMAAPGADRTELLSGADVGLLRTAAVDDALGISALGGPVEEQAQELDAEGPMVKVEPEVEIKTKGTIDAGALTVAAKEDDSQAPGDSGDVADALTRDAAEAPAKNDEVTPAAGRKGVFSDLRKQAKETRAEVRQSIKDAGSSIRKALGFGGKSKKAGPVDNGNGPAGGGVSAGGDSGSGGGEGGSGGGDGGGAE